MPRTGGAQSTYRESESMRSRTQYQDEQNLQRTRPSMMLYVRDCSLASRPHFFMSLGFNLWMTEPSTAAFKTHDRISATPSFPAMKSANCTQLQIAGSSDGGRLKPALMLSFPEALSGLGRVRNAGRRRRRVEVASLCL
jgi:hypothetical protein